MEGWFDSPGDDTTLMDQAEYGVDPLRVEAHQRRASQVRTNDELGRHAPTEAELAVARILLQGYQDDIVSDAKGKISFRRAIAHAERAALYVDEQLSSSSTS